MSLLQTTGIKTATLPEFIEAIKKVEPGAVFHHTHQSYLKNALIVPEYPNDFAVWVAQSLEERALAEKLASLDFFAMGSVTAIRTAIIRILEDYLQNFPKPRPSRKGDEFFFNDSTTLVIPAGFTAHRLDDFFESLQQVGHSSLYYHFFEARVRLGGPSDDFSFWLEYSLGLKDLSYSIRQLDPYLYSLESLREELLRLVREAL